MTNSLGSGLPDIDWNAVWRSQIRLRRQNGTTDCARLWNRTDYARRYIEAMEANNPEYFAHTIDAVHLEPQFKVLDIGAGPGAIALRMARKAAVVTAVEPAAGMADLLEARCRADGIKNIRCIRKRWEELDCAADLDGPYDVVLAAFSLGMEDLAQAIENMNRVCSGTVYLFWFAGQGSMERQYQKLWPRLHGRPHCSAPKADVVFNLLYQMGIYPDITAFPFRSSMRFATFEEALEEFGYRMGVKDPDSSPDLYAFLQTQLRKEGDDLVLSQEATCVRFQWRRR